MLAQMFRWHREILAYRFVEQSPKVSTDVSMAHSPHWRRYGARALFGTDGTVYREHPAPVAAIASAKLALKT